VAGVTQLTGKIHVARQSYILTRLHTDPHAKIGPEADALGLVVYITLIAVYIVKSIAEFVCTKRTC